MKLIVQVSLAILLDNACDLKGLWDRAGIIKKSYSCRRSH